MPLPLDAWILLRLERTSDGFVLHYTDSTGAQVPDEGGAPGDPWPSRPLAADLGDLRLVAYPPALGTLIQAIAGPFPDFQFSPHSTGPKPVAVFLEESDDVELERWLSFARTLLAEAALLYEGRYSLVVAPRRLWMPRPRFRLPIRVLAVGHLGSESLTALTSAYWYQGSAAIQSHGMEDPVKATGRPSGSKRTARTPWSTGTPQNT